MKGWRYEGYRHSLAARGIRTSFIPYSGYMVNVGRIVPRKLTEEERLKDEISYVKSVLEDPGEISEERKKELTDSLSRLELLEKEHKPLSYEEKEARHKEYSEAHRQEWKDERAEERLLNRLRNLPLEGETASLLSEEMLEGLGKSGRSKHPLDYVAKNNFYVRLWEGSAPDDIKGFFVAQPMVDSDEAKRHLLEFLKEKNRDFSGEDIFIDDSLANMSEKDISLGHNIKSISGALAHEELHHVLGKEIGFGTSQALDNVVMRRKPVLEVDDKTGEKVHYIDLHPMSGVDISPRKARISRIIEDAVVNGEISGEAGLKMRSELIEI